MKRKSKGNAVEGTLSRNHGKKSPKVELVGQMLMSKEGYGFVRVEGREDDIYIPARKMRGALNGDTVAILAASGVSASKKREGRGGSAEGEVLRVLERSKKPYVGILQIIGGKAWVIIESRVMPYDVQVPLESVQSEDEGKKVAVLVNRWERRDDAPWGEIVDVLGVPGENNTEMHAILAEYGLPYKFPDAVERAAATIPVEITPDEIARRRDFRDICTFTIDPADAKDFDDALSFRTLESGNFEVGVHIADVTHYVRPGDVLDKEAYERGTSVYLVDRTVPMLPEILSNNLCSLREGEEKLTFSAVFEMNAKAKVIKRWFGRTVIKSNKRFSYEQAQEIIEAAAAEEAVQPEVRQAVLQLHKLASIMRAKRFAEGSISFERPEMKVIVDSNGKPLDVVEKITKEANWLIEEFMLLANREVAHYVTKSLKSKAPTFVYRIHETPNEEKIKSLSDFVKNFGYKFTPSKNPREIATELNALMDESKGRPENAAISILALRSMARAEYSTDNVGHYGLGFDYYTHFTSPIRRYPDMMVHRLLARYMDKGRSEKKQLFEQMCQHASAREQLATEAERASIKYKTVEFMQDKLGKEYDGTISGITEWGLYVQIEPTKVEGMVALRDIKGDYFVFDEKRYCLRGKASRQVFTLGDKVRVKVERTNLEQKLLDYSLVWTPPQKRGAKSSAGSSAKSSAGSSAKGAAKRGAAKKSASKERVSKKSRSKEE
ncbi:MAG: ribonuclease R [bacterium]|nr:ribonuclease R [bacterium]MDY2650501.1 ribonuclease R [Candidatus Egerieousia sp.]